MPKSIFFSQFSEENSQFQVLKNFENKSSICLVKVDLKMCVQHVYSGFPITKISMVWTGGEFNNARARRALVDWYLSLFVMCKAWHQYNERLKALALLNSPQMFTFFYRRLLSVMYKFNLPFNYQGPGVLCPLTIGISAVDYFFVLIDNCPCKCNIKTCSPDA